MRMTKLLMLAGLAVAGVGGAAAADPCDEPAQVEAAYDYAPPVVVEQPVAPRVIVREGYYGRRYVRPIRREWRREREYRREVRREERRTARSYRHGSRW